MVLIPIVPIIPPHIISGKPQLPDNIEIGDIIIARYSDSALLGVPWEDWHHAAIVSKLNPLTIIEAGGKRYSDDKAGPEERTYAKSLGFGACPTITKMKWLKPVFPNPLREIDKKEVKWSKRKIISPVEARKRAVEFARQQIGEPYKLAIGIDQTADSYATKWAENEWYCSLLVFKAYSRTVTGMYLESYELRDADGNENELSSFASGSLVTPEDLIDSRRTQVYYTWQQGDLPTLNA